MDFENYGSQDYKQSIQKILFEDWEIVVTERLWMTSKKMVVIVNTLIEFCWHLEVTRETYREKPTIFMNIYEIRFPGALFGVYRSLQRARDKSKQVPLDNIKLR